ncbi:hypothetical protein FHX82_001851 [Amycolatopsis bartoniae]|uniref:hypothetical protein n=1 Tax=Amycolatopsis bartoniae TaxID=941986 RepID=UPI001193C1C0|nr:hypothetical protein [Amycolatopsis bartoniae]MBB2934831.1 hypothetical protein [Amycolatopsis bartoniae]TVT03073.1 hypothetical protein FNH07_26175 [Amycolatopsis bartoniae]
MEDAGTDNVGISLDQLIQLREVAKQTSCPKCSGYLKQLGELRAEMAGLKQLAALRGSAAPLPVPPLEGDRQGISFDFAAAQLVSRAVGRMRNGAHEEALGLLREAPQLMSPAQNAACITSFRQQGEHALADTLIRLFGREQPEKDVMGLTIALLDLGSTRDATAVLRMAVG